MTDNTGSTARLIYKIADRHMWEDATRTGSYAGSSDDLRDGFIHFSTREQLGETARKHFAGRTDLLLIAVPAPSLGSALKWEPSRGGALFPHLYAELPTADALWVRELRLGQDGIPDIDAALAERPEAGG